MLETAEDCGEASWKGSCGWREGHQVEWGISQGVMSCTEELRTAVGRQWVCNIWYGHTSRDLFLIYHLLYGSVCMRISISPEFFIVICWWWLRCRSPTKRGTAKGLQPPRRQTEKSVYHKHKRTTSTNTTLHSHILQDNFHDHQISVMRASHCSRWFILECAVFGCGGQLWGSANVQTGFGPGDSNSELCFTMFHQSSPSTLHTALAGDIQPLIPF